MVRIIYIAITLVLAYGCAEMSTTSFKKIISADKPAETALTRQEVKPFLNTSHGSYVLALTTSRDGKYAVSGSMDRTVKLWDINSGRLIRTFGKQKDDVAPGLAITPDSRYIFSADETVKSEPVSLYKWDTYTGKLLTEMKGHSSGITAISMSPDGKYVVSVEGQDNAIVWKTEDGSRYSRIDLRNMRPGSQVAESVQFMPDSKSFLVGYFEGKMSLVSIDGKIIRQYEVEKSNVQTVAVTSDGKFLAAGLENGTIQIKHADSGRLISTFKTGAESIRQILFTKDDKALIVLQNFKLFMIDFQTGEKIRDYKSQRGLYSITLSSDNKHLIAGGFENIQVYETHTGNMISDIGGFDEGAVTAYAYAINPAKDQMLLGGTAKEIRVIQTSTLRDIGQLKGHDLETTDIFYTADGKRAISRSMDKTIKIWDMESFKEIKSIPLESRGAMIISPDSRYAYAEHAEKFIQKIDLQTGRKLAEIEAHSKNIADLDVSSDGSYLISSSYDHSIRIWQTSDLRLVQELKGHKDFVSSAKITPDGNMAVSASDSYFDHDSSIRIWDIKTGRELYKIPTESSIRNLTLSKDSRYAFGGTDDGLVLMADLEKGKIIKKFTGHEAKIIPVALTGDGKYVIAGSISGTTKIWNIDSGEELLTSASFRNGEWVTITKDGFFDASANGAKYLNILTGQMSVASIDQYYETFYRPDIVAQALSLGKNVQYAVKKPEITINEIKLAPDVYITDTPASTDKEELKVTIKILPKNGGIGQIRLYLDNTMIKTGDDRALKAKESNAVFKSYTIKVPKGEHTLKAVVYNAENNMASKDAIHTVVSTYTPVIRPNVYAVVIGINEYKNPAIALKYAVSDAKLFADTIRERTPKLFGRAEVKLLTSRQNTTKENIISTLKSMQSLSANDLFIFYVASHGMVEDSKYHMITSNVGALSARGIKQEALAQDELKDAIANIPTAKKVIILDTCNSGALGEVLELALLTRGLNETAAMKLLSRAVGSTIISASSSEQEALEGYKGHGLLTYVLAEGLRGKADLDNDGYVKTLEIANYVEDTVPQIAEDVFKRAQYPYISPLGQGFPLVHVK